MPHLDDAGKPIPFGCTRLQLAYAKERLADPDSPAWVIAKRAGYGSELSTPDQLSAAGSKCERSDRCQSLIQHLTKEAAEGSQGKIMSWEETLENLTWLARHGSPHSVRAKASETLGRFQGSASAGAAMREMSDEQMDRELEHALKQIALDDAAFFERLVAGVREFVDEEKRKGSASQRALAPSTLGGASGSDLATDAEEARGESDASMEREARGSGGDGKDAPVAVGECAA